MLKYYFLGLLIVVACSGQETTRLKNTSLAAELSLDSFNETAIDTNKLSFYFSKSEQDLKNKNYLFTGGFNNLAYVSINKTLTKIKLDSTNRTKETCGDCGYVDYYSSGQYNIIVDIQYRNEYMNWPSPYRGHITIINAEGTKITQGFYGESRTPASFYQTNAFKMYTMIKKRIPDKWIKVKQREWVKENKIYSGIDIHMDKESQIHLNYVNDKYGCFFESYRITDFKNYDDSIVLVTDNFHGDSIFHWTFRPMNKNKAYWSAYKIQANTYEELGLFKAQD